MKRSAGIQSQYDQDTPEKRSEIGKKGAAARWKVKDEEGVMGQSERIAQLRLVLAVERSRLAKLALADIHRRADLLRPIGRILDDVTNFVASAENATVSSDARMWLDCAETLLLAAARMQQCISRYVSWRSESMDEPDRTFEEPIQQLEEQVKRE